MVPLGLIITVSSERYDATKQQQQQQQQQQQHQHQHQQQQYRG